jgi:hypothetical protein
MCTEHRRELFNARKTWVKTLVRPCCLSVSVLYKHKGYTLCTVNIVRKVQAAQPGNGISRETRYFLLRMTSQSSEIISLAHPKMTFLNLFCGGHFSFPGSTSGSTEPVKFGPITLTSDLRTPSHHPKMSPTYNV